MAPDDNTRFDGSIPAAYDRYLGPVIFEPYAQDLAARAAAAGTGGQRVLELACGTGILTGELRRRLPRGARLTATDLNEPMLAYARAKFDPAAPILWRQADAAALPFPGHSFDVLVCQFGLMFVPDKAAPFREARRVLALGGLFAFNVWDSLAHNPFGRIANDTIGRFFADNPPDFYQVPFGLHQPAVLLGLLAEHGFTAVDLQVLPLVAKSPSAREFAIGLVTGNPIVTAIRERSTVTVEPIIAAVADDLRSAFGDHPLRSPMQALVVTARCSS